MSDDSMTGPFPAGSPEATLLAALEALDVQVPAELDGASALARTKLLMVSRERLHGLTLQAIADVDTRQLHTLDEQPTTTCWVQAQHVPGVDGRDVTLARRLRKVPSVAEQLRAGHLSAQVAAQVTTAVTKARPFLDRPDGLIDGQPGEPVLYGVCVDGICQLLAEQTGGTLPDDPHQDQLRAELEAIVCPDPATPDPANADRAGVDPAGPVGRFLAGLDRSQHRRLEAALVLFALRSQPGLGASGLALLLDALLPAQHEKRAREAEDRRGLTLTPHGLGSGWTVRGQLDDLTGEMLHTVLTAQSAVDPDNPTDTDAWRHAHDTPHLTDLPPEHWPAAQPRPRSKAEQRHDALRDALRRILDTAGLGHRDKTSPHLLITVDLDTIHDLPGALPARTLTGLRLARHQLRELLCASRFTRLVRDARRRIIDTSHSQRTLTAAERQILYAQWAQRCARTGCIRGPATGDRLVPHHGELYSHTGTTSLDDTVPLCEQDHHYLHHDHHTLTLKDRRVLGPHGWITAAA